MLIGLSKTSIFPVDTGVRNDALIVLQAALNAINV
jgi:hypothetical protein